MTKKWKCERQPRRTRIDPSQLQIGIGVLCFLHIGGAIFVPVFLVYFLNINIWFKKNTHFCVSSECTNANYNFISLLGIISSFGLDEISANPSWIAKQVYKFQAFY